MPRFTVRTTNVRDNPHLKSIEAVLEKHGVMERMGFVYEMRGPMGNDAMGGGYQGDIPDHVADEIRALDVPKSAKIKWG